MKKKGPTLTHVAMGCAIAALALSSQAAAHQRYRVAVLPRKGVANSPEAGYLF